ncbi:uncharacterized protein [Henckelia pumila]|uniref:uncharacterized protein n=1 Tax=Henckelia pumila TaxID=405737 RepID=UPI003C6E78BF
MSSITQNVLLVDLHTVYDLLDEGYIFKQALPKFFQDATISDGVITSSIGGEFITISPDIFSASFNLPRTGMTTFSSITTAQKTQMKAMYSLTNVPWPLRITIAIFYSDFPLRFLQARCYLSDCVSSTSLMAATTSVPSAISETLKVIRTSIFTVEKQTHNQSWSMAKPGEVEFCLKATVIKERNQVLFVEADHKFIDVLLSFLTLPLGTIVRLLHKYYDKGALTIGCLNSLYHSLENTSTNYFWSESGKMMLLKPTSSFADECDQQLKINIDDTPPRQSDMCCNANCTTMYFNTIQCSCGLKIKNKISTEEIQTKAERTTAGLFTKPNTSFIITDDFQILPNHSDLFLEILNMNGVRDRENKEEIPFHVGYHQVMALLERAIASRTPMSDVIFGTRKERMKYFVPSHVFLGTVNLPKMKVKAIVQQSTGRILLIESDDGGFVDCLFNFLAIPLGSAHLICGGDCGIPSMTNLYNSMLRLDPERHMKAASTINRLKNPELPHGYKSRMQILPLKEEEPPKLRWWQYLRLHLRSKVKNIDPKGGPTFLKPLDAFIVSEDLVVSSTASSSLMSTINTMNIPLSDIKLEMIEIGVAEATSLLKATLTSRRALTDGLRDFLP